MIKFYALIKSRVLNRRTFTFFGLLLCSATAFSQNVGINGTGTAPHPSAGLDVSFTDKGLLIPRVKLKSSADITTIPSPEISLLVYNTEEISDVTPGYYFYDGRAWQKLSTTSTTGLTSSSWGLSGNSVSSDNHFLGTTNNDALKFRTNNLHRMIIDSDGSVGIGSNPVFATDKEKVLIDLGGSTSEPLPVTSYTGLNIKGYVNNYLQFNIQNKFAGNAASTDIIATADNGTEENYYVDLGINSSKNDQKKFGGINDSYLYNLGGDFLIGTGANKNLQFLTGGQSETANERMRITGAGFVGIGTKTPRSKLEIYDTQDPLRLGGVQVGTSDFVLVLEDEIVKKVDKATLTSGSWSTSGNQTTKELKLGTNTPFSLSFITSGAERMKITSTNGKVGIGFEQGAYFEDSDAQLLVNGPIEAPNYLSPSDRRLKKDIENLEYGLSSITQLQPVSYNWLDPKLSAKKQIGLIAQDVKSIIPEIVQGDEDKGKLSINYTELIPVLINAIKEQQQKIDSQQKQIDELKELIKQK
ncbi:tail fiber domain-containing protein [Desertivirga brevis]|uniref:tail fiber domain-containing protein n=1 Tax=Desertivirga brevis TaxID=2810310 RepID=UPI001A9686F2|nr:tail fiber domain-containing protein [Pedobacter sp. SYSU D00873]